MYDHNEKFVAGCVTLIVLGFFVYWGAVLYVAQHFIRKFW